MRFPFHKRSMNSSNILCLVLFCLLAAVPLFNGGVEASRRHKLYLQSVHRTGYHFQPTSHWINDPNGPMYYKGIYHLFYQYNPNGAVWSRDIVWAHSVSKDLINWKRLPVALYPSKPFDNYGCWSGSATILADNTPVIIYTGIIDQNQTQVQNYAVPANLSDPYLTEWIKPDNNPLITADESIDKNMFRDPTTAWYGRDGYWRITLGGSMNQTGIAYSYKSKNFMKTWTKAEHPLHLAPKTGNWECPDFYPVSTYSKNGLDTSTVGSDVKHVLKASLAETAYDYYTLGTYDPDIDRYTPDDDMIDGWNGLRYDYGKFYASKSFFDPSKNRRILWGWANESDSTDDDIQKGWAGIQLIPRTIVLDPNGKQLLQWPVEEVKTLRGKKVKLRNQVLKMGEMVEVKGITAAQADIDATFSFGSLDKAEPFDPSWDRYDAQKLCGQKRSSVQGGLGPFGILTLASENLEEYTPVFFRVFQDGGSYLVLMCSDASRSTFKASFSSTENDDAYRPSYGGFVNVDLSQKKISLRSLIDNSVVESFAARGRTCISSRVYPSMAIYDNAHLYVFNNGTEPVKVVQLEAWSMSRPIEMNQ